MIREYAGIFCWKNVSSFCIAKATHIFSAKNIRILCIESAKTVNEMTLNELVKLTTLWTTGPGILSINTILIYFMINIEKSFMIQYRMGLSIALFFYYYYLFIYLYFYFFILFYILFLFIYLFIYFVIPRSSIFKVPQHTYSWKAPFFFFFFFFSKKKKKKRPANTVR